MTPVTQIIKSQDFEALSEVKVDTRKRITLRKAKKAPKLADYYRVYENSLGQIVLDPMAIVPAYERWLHKNPKALESVKRGLAQAKAGKLLPAKESFAKYAGG